MQNKSIASLSHVLFEFCRLPQSVRDCVPRRRFYGQGSCVRSSRVARHMEKAVCRKYPCECC